MTGTVTPLAGKARTAVAESTSRINLYEGSVRSGKTVASLIAWLHFLRTGPAGNLVMIGRTERTLRRNVIDPLREMLGPKRCKVTWGEGEALILGRRVYLVGASSELAVGKIQGITLAGAYGDEVVLWPEAFWSQLLARLSVEGARLFGTCNPDNPQHWLMTDYLTRASVWVRHDGTIRRDTSTDALDLTRVSWRLADNPTLPAAYVAELRKTFTGLWRKRFVDGLWVLAEGAIYDMWDTERHVVADIPRRSDGTPALTDWIVAVDYGTSNPFNALLIGVDHRRRRLVVAREWRWDSRKQGRQKTDAEYARDLRTWIDGLADDLGGEIDIAGTYIDPSAASFMVQLWRDNWRGTHHADNTVSDGIRHTASLIANGALLVHESCTGLTGEIGGYVWDADHARRTGEERPMKVDDHAVDALRYGVGGLRRHWRHWVAADLVADAA